MATAAPDLESALTITAAVVRGSLGPDELRAMPACHDLASMVRGPMPGLETVLSPESLGLAYENALSAEDRRRGGVWYTPAPLVEWVVNQTLDLFGTLGQAPRVLDPACGSGAFLVGMARALKERGFDAETTFEALTGWDIDPHGLLVARAALELTARELGWPAAVAGRAHLVEGDFLASGVGQLSLGDPVADVVLPDADIVVGNPPFLSPLRARAARNKNERERLQTALGGVANRWVDTAALFVKRSLEVLPQGGVVSLVLPASTFATQDAEPVRRSAASESALVGLWIDGTPRAFEGGVPVCAAFFKRGDEQPSTCVAVPRWSGLTFEEMPPCMFDPRAAVWSSLLIMDSDALPDVGSKCRNKLGDFATVTADFRDQFYSLAAHVVEADDLHSEDVVPVIVTGLIDPARNMWGARTARFDKRVWKRPSVSRHDLLADQKLSTWAQSRLQPKVLVATQTRVLEAVVDINGEFAPVPPILTVVPTGADPWVLAAAISSPIAANWARTRSAGAALSLDAIKLSASQLRDLPLPDDLSRLEPAAASFRRAQDSTDDEGRQYALRESAMRACEAYGLDATDTEDAIRWWEGRLRQHESRRSGHRR